MLACISARRGVIGFKVPMGGVLCAKKFALRAQNTPKSAFDGPLGEFFRGNATGWAVLGEVFRGNAAGGPLLGEFFRGPAVVGRSSPVEWCNRFVSFGLGYALSWSGVSSCPVGCGVSRDLVRMSRLR